MSFQEDSYYIDKVLDDDQQAFASLVEKHKAMVYTVAYRVLGRHEDAEEAAQDSFVKAYQSLSKFEKKSKFSTWLFRIAYNTAISKARKKQITVAPLDSEVVENYSDHEIFENLDVLDEYEQKTILEAIMQKLSPEERSIISMFYLQDLSTEEIAGITQLSQSNVKVKLHRIRNKMQWELSKILRRKFSNNFELKGDTL